MTIRPVAGWRRRERVDRLRCSATVWVLKASLLEAARAGGLPVDHHWRGFNPDAAVETGRAYDPDLPFVPTEIGIHPRHVVAAVEKWERIVGEPGVCRVSWHPMLPRQHYARIR